MSNLIDYVNNKYLPEKDYDDFRVGDQVRVHQIIKEADGKDRIQIFEGIVIAMKGKGISKTFTVRKVSYGVGVEKIFPYYSPLVAKVEVVRRFKVRRAKLYYLRDKVGKDAKLKEVG
ncbi:MAG: 50S ribosomal protein L19 [Brevinematia bacterium]